jgi:4-carboxymuconolactone decarboxylase
MGDRHERGMKIYAESFGVPEADLRDAFNHRVGSIYAEEAIFTAGGPAWSDPALPDRDRSVAILTALICQGVLGERLDAHLERAVNNGVDRLGPLTFLHAMNHPARPQTTPYAAPTAQTLTHASSA